MNSSLLVPSIGFEPTIYCLEHSGTTVVLRRLIVAKKRIELFLWAYETREMTTPPQRYILLQAGKQDALPYALLARFVLVPLGRVYHVWHQIHLIVVVAGIRTEDASQ